MKLRSVIYYAGLAITLVLTPPASQAEVQQRPGALFTMDNASSGNHVLAYRRSADGNLTLLGQFATGGIGTGEGLGSQGARSCRRLAGLMSDRQIECNS